MKDEQGVFGKALSIDYTEPACETSFEEFCKVVESRRSVRVFDSTPVPEDLIRKCLDLALLAPNSSNLQAWEFIWVRDSQRKQDLIKACLSQPAARTARELIVCIARTRTWRQRSKEMLEFFAHSDTKVPAAVFQYYRRLVPIVYTQGPMNIFGLAKKIALSVIGIFRPIPREPTNSSDMKIWAVKSTALACENLMLGFRAGGFDSCPMEGFDSTRVKKLFKLSSDSVVVMILGVGRRAPNGVYGPRVRFDRNKFIKEI